MRAGIEEWPEELSEPRPDQFLKGAPDDGNGHRCLLGWAYHDFLLYGSKSEPRYRAFRAFERILLRHAQKRAPIACSVADANDGFLTARQCANVYRDAAIEAGYTEVVNP